MPKIPKYEAGQVTPRPLPGPRFSPSATAESFGGVQAQELGEAGAALEQVATLAAELNVANQERINLINSEDIFNQYTIAANAFMEEEVKAKRAGDAERSFDDTKKGLGELRKQYMKGLDNTSQRAMFGKAAGRSEVGYLNTALKHQQHEIMRRRVHVGKQSIMTATENAVAAIGNPVLLQTMLIEGERIDRDKVPTFPENLGMKTTNVERAISSAGYLRYGTVLGAIEKKQGSRAALAFFKASTGKFDPLFVPDMEKRLKKSAEFELVWAKAKEISGLGLPIKEQLKLVDAIPTGGTEDLMTAVGAKTLRSQLQERERQRALTVKAEAQALLDAEWDIVRKAGKDGVVPNTVDPLEQKKMQAYITRRNEDHVRSISGAPALFTTVGGWKIFNKIMSSSPRELAGVDVTEYIDIMAPKEYDKAEAHFRMSKNKANRAMTTRSAIVNQTMGELTQATYFDPKQRSKWQKGLNVTKEHIQQRTGWFYEQMDLRLDQYPENEQNSALVGEIARTDLLQEVEVEIPWSKNLFVKRFEVPYLSDLGFGEQERTEALKHLPDIFTGDGKFNEEAPGYDEDVNEFYFDQAVPGGGVKRNYYDQASKYKGSKWVTKPKGKQSGGFTVIVGGEE